MGRPATSSTAATWSTARITALRTTVRAHSRPSAKVRAWAAERRRLSKVDRQTVELLLRARLHGHVAPLARLGDPSRQLPEALLERPARPGVEKQLMAARRCRGRVGGDHDSTQASASARPCGYGSGGLIAPGDPFPIGGRAPGPRLAASKAFSEIP